MALVVVTGAGVVISDPINADAATWLKAEVSKLTDQPITQLIYSHSHGDHASGVQSFGAVPNVLAQAMRRRILMASFPPYGSRTHIASLLGPKPSN